MDSWDRARLIGTMAKARLDAIMADPDASKRLEAEVVAGNALLSVIRKRKRDAAVENSTSSQRPI